MPSLLITAIGQQSYLVEAFREALSRDGTLVIADASSRAAAFAVPVPAVTLPEAGDPRFIAAVAATCARHGLRWVLSLNDPELLALDRARAALRRDGIEILGPQGDNLMVCVDKRNTHVWLRRHGFLHPPTLVGAESIVQQLTSGGLILPAIGKLATGRGSRRQRVLTTPEEVRSWLASLGIGDRDAAMVQPLLSGTEYGVDLVNTLDGVPAAVLVREKILMREGETATARTVRQPAIEAMGWELAAALGHRGLVDTDVFLTDDGPVVLDINPRFGGGYPFVHLAGANVPAAIVAWLRGEAPRPEDLTYLPGVIGTRNGLGGRVERVPQDPAKAPR